MERIKMLIERRRPNEHVLEHTAKPLHLLRPLGPAPELEFRSSKLEHKHHDGGDRWATGQLSARCSSSSGETGHNEPLRSTGNHLHLSRIKLSPLSVRQCRVSQVPPGGLKQRLAAIRPLKHIKTRIKSHRVDL